MRVYSTALVGVVSFLTMLSTSIASAGNIERCKITVKNSKGSLVIEEATDPDCPKLEEIANQVIERVLGTRYFSPNYKISTNYQGPTIKISFEGGEVIQDTTPGNRSVTLHHFFTAAMVKSEGYTENEWIDLFKKALD